MKKIAVDAMGGDYAPQAIVEGVNQALASTAIFFICLPLSVVVPNLLGNQ